MLAKQQMGELDTYVARLVDEALGEARSRDERLSVLRTAAEMGRHLSLSPIQAELFSALVSGQAPTSFGELHQDVESRHRRLTRSFGKRHMLGGRTGARGRGQRKFSTPPMLTPGEVARELGVSSKTVTNWCKKGLLRCELLESGHRRIPASALDAYRSNQAQWDQLDSLSHAARGDVPEPDETAIFEEIAQRRRS